MPREIVFRLKGGDDRKPVGAVDVPLVVVVDPVPPVPVPGVAGVLVVLDDGDTSGENSPPMAYSERFRPYCLARVRFTSRISTSNMISARALSFCSMILPMICTSEVVARTVIV